MSLFCALQATWAIPVVSPLAAWSFSSVRYVCFFTLLSLLSSLSPFSHSSLLPLLRRLLPPSFISFLSLPLID